MSGHRRQASCSRCGRVWHGTRQTHCSLCHEQFTTHSAFDRHLDVVYGRDPAVKCLDPAEAGLELRDLRDGPVWTQPIKGEGPAARRYQRSESDAR